MYGPEDIDYDEDTREPCGVCGQPATDWLCDVCAEQERLWTWRPEDVADDWWPEDSGEA